MGDVDEKFATLLREHVKEHAPKAMSIGTAVNIGDDTCDVEFDNEADLLDVKLHAVIDDTLDSTVVIKPKENSKVVIGFLDNTKESAVILQCSEVEEVVIKNKTVTIRVNATGVLVQKGSDSLKDVLTDIITAVKQIMVLYGNNPDYEKLTEAQTKVNNIFL